MNAARHTIEEAMQAALAGDQRAYAAVLEQAAALVRPYLLRHLGAAASVEDVLQEVLISVHKARHTYDGQRPFKPWLFAIARYRLHDYLRGHYHDPLRHAAPIEDAENLPEDVTETGIRYESIQGEIDRLPGKQPTILRMMHQEGYTASEVADRMQMTTSAVKVAAHRAYQQLRRKLRP